VIAEYGEERFAVQIAGAIAARVRRDGDAALLTTLELAELRFDPDVYRLVPQRILERFKMIPLSVKEGVLTLAMVDPSDLAALDVELLTLYGNVGVGFGLGFASTIDQVATGALTAHDFYWGGAASTVFWVDPAEDLWVVFATQLMPSASFDFRGQLRSLVYAAIID
jgi:CubicO group peptidase (beta-lactamase class C family)